MLTLLKRYYPVLLALVGAMLLVGVGYRMTSNRAELKQTQNDLAKTNTALMASEKARAESWAEQLRLAAIDKKHYEEYSNAQKENAALRDRIATGADRVYIRTTKCSSLPGAATTASVDDETGYAELNREDAANLISIANDGDDAIRQLTALQEWVREVGEKE